MLRMVVKKFLVGFIILSSIVFFSMHLAVSAVDEEAKGPIYGGFKVANQGLDKAGSVQGGMTYHQPFPAGTAGSSCFRIPSLITLQNGSLAAAADARWNQSKDGGGLDTIFSVSKDNGVTWKYSFPIWFPDSDKTPGTTTEELKLATTVIDPVMIQDQNGTIYLIADVNPTGVTTMEGFTYPNQGTGYIGVDGKDRLAITADYSKVNTNPVDGRYEYYVGDFINGYAPIVQESDHTETDYIVDECFNLFKKRNNVYQALEQKQVNSETMIQQNVFYKDSELHAYNTGYMWLAKSDDNGETWKHEILNAQIKGSDEKAFLVSPGRGTLLDSGRIVIPFYAWNRHNSKAQQSTFIFSDDGVHWTRTPDVPFTVGNSSECELVELNDNTLRLFARNQKNHVCYADAVWNESTKNYEWQSSINITNVPSHSDCNVSAIKYSKKIDGKDAIFVACPGNSTGNRSKGRIFVFLVDEALNMELAYTYHVNEGAYLYSCLTELSDGSIGLLWETSWQAIRYDNFDITKIAPGAIIDGAKRINVPIFQKYTELLSENFERIDEKNENIVDITSRQVATANRGTDCNFNGERMNLEQALYTFRTTSGGFIVSGQTAEGTTVYLGLQGQKAGFPQAITQNAKIVIENDSNDKVFLKSIGTYTGYLYFHKDSSNQAKNHSFDQVMNNTNNPNGVLSYELYEPSTDETTGVFGYKPVTTPKDGGKYLIVSEHNNEKFVLIPSTDMSNRYTHVGKINTITSTCVSYEGKNVGQATFLKKDTNQKYAIDVFIPKQLNAGDYMLTIGDTETLIKLPQEYSIMNQTFNQVADFKVASQKTNLILNVGKGMHYGNLVSLEKALYTIIPTGNGTFSVQGTLDNGEIVYLGMRSGQAGFPQTKDGKNSEVTILQNGQGIFSLITKLNGFERWLYFHSSGDKVGTFDQHSSYHANTEVMLYRVDSSAIGSDIPGFKRIMNLNELVSDGLYLIVAKVNNTFYALYPSNAVNGGAKEDHVIELTQKDAQTLSTKESTMYHLNVQGKKVGYEIIQLSNGMIFTIYIIEKQYTIRQNTSDQGTVTIDKEYAKVGEKVILTVEVKEGYEFSHWETNMAGLEIVDNGFTMPDGDVVITAIFKEKQQQSNLDNQDLNGIIMNEPSVQNKNPIWIYIVVSLGVIAIGTALFFVVKTVKRKS